MIVRIVETGGGGSRLEAEAIQHGEGVAPLVAGNQEVDVGRRADTVQAVETRFVVQPLEHDGPDTRAIEGAQAFFGDLTEDHVAGRGDQTIASKELRQLGGERCAAGCRQQG